MAFPQIEYSVCVVVMALLTGVYVIAGGYMATAINDFIQGIIMLFGIVLVIAVVLSQNGGFIGSLDALAIRILIVVFIVVSAFIALNKDKLGYIADMMGISWGALAGAFLAPFMYGLYSKKITKTAVWASFVFGAGIMLLNMFVRQSFPAVLQSPINCGVIAMLGGLVIVPIVSLFTKKPDNKDTEEMFACYNDKVVVSAKESLGNM